MGRKRIINLNGRGSLKPAGLLSAGWHQFSVDVLPDRRELVLGDDREQACYVMDGEGEAQFDGGSETLGPGSTIVLPLGSRAVLVGRGAGLRLFRVEMTVAEQTSEFV